MFMSQFDETPLKDIKTLGGLEEVLFPVGGGGDEVGMVGSEPVWRCVGPVDRSFHGDGR